ncbi:MAG: tRNA dihydrouridine synthase DusB [Clostridia bacterium]|nr:tRNA dihydrouridine synthase DusB [Clostridia bacterium]MDD4686162.1 tRNA dihydrouridine synthase DusB [Clostridia bacterium]
MEIDDIELKSNLFLAPMAGVTDFAFRSLSREFGAGFSYTEMVSSKGLIYSKNNDIYEKMLYTLPNESPVAVQLFGNEPDIMALACKHPLLQKFDCIDINMGCPAPKIIKNGEGSALLKNFKLAEQIVKICVKESNKPITVKMRTGFETGSNVSLELGKILEEAGASAICLHGRTREQFYSGEVNYEAIAKLKSALKIPVIGNGNVVDVPSYNKMLETGCDAVMIGRGALGKPWIFSTLNPETTKADIEINKKEVITKHIKLLKQVYPERFIVTHMRKHLLWYVKDIPCASQLRLKLCRIESIKEALTYINEIF